MLLYNNVVFECLSTGNDCSNAGSAKPQMSVPPLPSSVTEVVRIVMLELIKDCSARKARLSAQAASPSVSDPKFPSFRVRIIAPGLVFVDLCACVLKKVFSVPLILDIDFAKLAKRMASIGGTLKILFHTISAADMHLRQKASVHASSAASLYSSMDFVSVFRT